MGSRIRMHPLDMREYGYVAGELVRQDAGPPGAVWPDAAVERRQAAGVSRVDATATQEAPKSHDEYPAAAQPMPGGGVTRPPPPKWVKRRSRSEPAWIDWSRLSLLSKVDRESAEDAAAAAVHRISQMTPIPEVVLCSRRRGDDNDRLKHFIETSLPTVLHYVEEEDADDDGGDDEQSLADSATKRFPNSSFSHLEAVTEKKVEEEEKVVGYEDAKGSIEEMVRQGGQRRLYSQLGLSASGGILLFGPPGCSKTMLARTMARESSRSLVVMQGPQLLSKWLGESERAIRALFSEARSKSPSLLFLDEIDSVASRRDSFTSSGSGRESSATERILTQLLIEFDAAAASEDVVVVAATNRPDLLDIALLRPGRLDRLVYCPPPNKECMLRLLRQALEPNLSQDDDIFFGIAATATSLNFSGAEALGLVRTASLKAIECDSPSVTVEHFRFALGQVKPVANRQLLDFYESWNALAHQTLPTRND